MSYDDKLVATGLVMSGLFLVNAFVVTFANPMGWLDGGVGVMFAAGASMAAKRK